MTLKFNPLWLVVLMVLSYLVGWQFFAGWVAGICLTGVAAYRGAKK